MRSEPDRSLTADRKSAPRLVILYKAVLTFADA